MILCICTLPFPVVHCTLSGLILTCIFVRALKHNLPTQGIWPGVFWADSVGGLPESEITIAAFLKMNGLNYSTAIVGKWHLGNMF